MASKERLRWGAAMLARGVASPRDSFYGNARSLLFSGHCRAELRIVASLAGFVVLAGALMMCPRATALNVGLDVSQYAHTAWKIRDGFTKGTITAITQTPDGYLLLGTEFGLLRFDGVKAVPWEPPGGQLPSQYIRSLLVTRDGTLWIGANKGLASWKEGKLTRYPGLGEFAIGQLLEDHEGTVWVSQPAPRPPGRLCAIRNGNVQCYGEDVALGPVVAGLFEDSQGNLWAGVTDGLWRWRPGPPKFFPFPGGATIRALGEDTDGALLVGWKGGLRRIRADGKTEAYAPLRSFQPFNAHRLFRDRDGGLWIATLDKGLLHLHQGRVDVFAQPDGLSGNLLLSIFEDREGDIWVASLGGLDRFREFPVATFGAKQGLPTDSTTSVLADRDGSVWMGGLGELYRWKNGEINTYNKRDGKINGTFPMSLFQDSHGRVWVSTHEKPGGAGYFEHGHYVLSAVRAKYVFSLAEDKAGNLWMADQEVGLFRLSKQNEVQQIPWEKFGHKDDAIALAVDPAQDGLWMGFFQGGLIYYADGKIQKSYTAADGLGSGRVYSLRFGSLGWLWAATEGGLSRMKNGRIATLTSKNGLPCDSVQWMIEDADHFMWLYMPCGLVRIARDELNAWVDAVAKDKNAKPTIAMTLFDNSDGMRSRSAVGGFGPWVAKSADGKLWMTSYDGVAVVDPKHLPINKIPPPVHVERVIADHKAYEMPTSTSGSLPLPAQTRDLQIDYTALSLVAAEKVQFKYKLEGFDRDWQDAGNRRQAFYTNLSPKKYTFRVKACNNSGVWNEAGTFLNFSVAPAYYQTIWFRSLCVAALLALLWAAYQYRLRQIAREYNVRLDERVLERTRIARELHDSLLQGFQGLMFHLQAARNLLPGRAPEAIKALETALERGDQAILEGRESVADLREAILGDSDIPRALTALGEELVLQCNGATPPCVRVLVAGKQRELHPELRDEIYRITREALRNAFRHSQAQKIETEITYGPSAFVLRVRDDGIGIERGVTNQGARKGHWGLPGMRERAEKFGGQLEVWSEHGAGTEIALTIPASIAYAGLRSRTSLRLFRPKKRQAQS